VTLDPPGLGPAGLLLTRCAGGVLPWPDIFGSSVCQLGGFDAINQMPAAAIRA